MYEHFRHELAAAIGGMMDGEQLQQVMAAVDAVSAGYVITGKVEAADQDGPRELPELARVYLMARSTEGLSKRSIRLYEVILKRFFADVKKEPDEVATADVRSWMADYQSKLRQRDAGKLSRGAQFLLCVAGGRRVYRQKSREKDQADQV